MKRHYDIAIIGAGPSGMAAAMRISNHKSKTILFDEQPAPGGQIYRGSDNPILSSAHILGADYAYGSSFLRQFRDSNIEYLPSSTIWQLSKDLEIGVSREGRSCLITADHIILASGAIERPFPIPGWTLPGVATIGSAQILLKSSGLVEDNSVLVGTGPLLYLFANQYLRAGVTIRAIIDTNPRANKWRALKHIPTALKKVDLLNKGWNWMTKLRRSNIPFYNEVHEIKIHGDKQVSSISFKTNKNAEINIQTEKIFIHQGVVPNVNLPMAAGCDHQWDPLQLCWKPVTKINGETSISGLWIAGDGAGIIGARGSEAAGHITAAAVLEKIGIKQPLKGITEWQKILKDERAFRPFIDTLFQPCKSLRVPQNDETIVCRCEEITAGEIRKNITLGCIGPNQLKAFCRAGMGACQGRFCGLTVSEMIASERRVSVPEVGYYRLRPPVKPLTLSELASLNEII